jgi:8-oxo-dGTP pyrophosphatase MutT (NUDIX family)
MPIIHQSGAIVIRRDRKMIRVLLITTKRSRENWIFPKGHIEKGETPEAAALREVKEEAGVVGKLIGPAGAIEYGFLGARARVEYFLAELSREAGPPEDGRDRLWCEVDEALERLSHKSTRKLLRQVWRQVAASAER